MNGPAILFGLVSLAMFGFGVGSFVIRQTPGPDEEVRRWITRVFGVVMLLMGTFWMLVTALFSLIPNF
jgi:hypothetical protein